MVFDEAELAALRKNAPDFKESYDMGMSLLLPPDFELKVQGLTIPVDVPMSGSTRSIYQVSNLPLRSSWLKVRRSCISDELIGRS